MKNKKIILGLSALLAVSGLAMSCGNKPQEMTPEEKVEEVYNSLIYDGLDSCTTDITLIYEIPDVKGVEITYSTSGDQNAATETPYLKISDDKKKAIVTRPGKGTTEKGYALVFLNAKIKCENVEKNWSKAVKVIEGSPVTTIGDVLKVTSENKDNVVSVKGYVVAVGDGCCYIADKTGAILVYSSTAVVDIAVGDSVLAEGSLSFYQGVPQFAYAPSAKVGVTLTKLDETVDFTPTAATVWDGAKVSEYMDYKTADKLSGNHIKVTGTLTISGKYYNMTIPGTTKGNGAAICYPNEAMKTQLAELDGKAITVTGYTLYISHDYMYVIAEKIEAATISEDEMFDAAVSNVTVKTEVYDSIELASTSLYNSTVTWTSNNDAIKIGADGHTATVTQGSADVTVELTATIKMGSKTTQKKFTVTVKATVSFAHAGTEADPFTVADAIMKAKQTGTTPTTEKYYIKGIVKSVNTSGLAQYGNINIDMIDEGKENDVFLAFQVYYQGDKFTEETAALVTVGSTVVVCGSIQNYNDKTPETTNKGSASVISVSAGAPVAATGVKANASLEVKVGKTASITATVEPSNATDKALTYTSKDQAIATVSDKGVVTGVAVGDTTITVALASNSAIKAEVAIHVAEAGQDPVGEEKVAVYDFTSLAAGSELKTTDAAKTLLDSVADENNALVSVTEVSKVYQGNGKGGAHENEGGLLKFGTGSAQGKLALNFGDAKLSKVVINCHDFYKVSDQYPTNSNKIAINGGEAVLAPYNATGAGEDMEFTLDGASTLSIVATNRIVIFSITVYYK